MKRVYLALGSNLGDREANLRIAIGKLHGPDLQVVRISSVYETAAVYYLEQPDFLNCVVEADTDLLPMRLLRRVGSIERSMGRKRAIPKGPRNIDIDILLYGPAVLTLRIYRFRILEWRSAGLCWSLSRSLRRISVIPLTGAQCVSC